MFLKAYMPLAGSGAEGQMSELDLFVDTKNNRLDTSEE